MVARMCSGTIQTYNVETASVSWHSEFRFGVQVSLWPPFSRHGDFLGLHCSTAWSPVFPMATASVLSTSLFLCNVEWLKYGDVHLGTFWCIASVYDRAYCSDGIKSGFSHAILNRRAREGPKAEWLNPPPPLPLPARCAVTTSW